MRTTQAGVNLIKSFEGCKLSAYLDSVGICTIGYGHTGPDVRIGETITQDEADELLYGDILRKEDGVIAMLKTGVTDNEFDALVSFAFNLGLSALKGSTLLRMVNAMEFEKAADEFLRWDHAGGKVLPGLTRRRKAERDLFLGE